MAVNRPRGRPWAGHTTHRVTHSAEGLAHLPSAHLFPNRRGDGFLTPRRYNVRWDGCLSFQQYAREFIRPLREDET